MVRILSEAGAQYHCDRCAYNFHDAREPDEYGARPCPSCGADAEESTLYHAQLAAGRLARASD